MDRVLVFGTKDPCSSQGGGKWRSWCNGNTLRCGRSKEGSNPSDLPNFINNSLCREALVSLIHVQLNQNFQPDFAPRSGFCLFVVWN